MNSPTLSWLPFDVDEWHHRTRFCSLAEKGALMEAITTSWSATLRGDVPGTLPNTDTALERLFGALWREVVDAVRAHFQVDPDNPSRLRCAWLADLYAAQLAKHATAVENGRKGGWQKGRKRGPRNSQAIAQVSVSSREVEVDPVGGSFGAPTTGGVVAAVARGGATATPPPDPIPPAAPPDPVPVTVTDVHTWAESCPEVRREAECEVDTLLDADNKGWRERPAGAGIRNRLVEAKLADRYLRARRRGTTTTLGALLSPHHPSHGSLPGAAHA